MRPYHDSSGPTIEKTVLDRLHRLDHTLLVTFSRWALDHRGQPMEVNPQPDWEPQHVQRVHRCAGSWLFLDPAFHLWSRSADGDWVHVLQYPAERGFGHREVYALEADAARWMKAAEILAAQQAAIDHKNERGKARFDEVRRDVEKENASAIGDLVFGKKSTTRAPRVFSYSGQTDRRSSDEKTAIQKTDKELGWVRPTPRDYEA